MSRPFPRATQVVGPDEEPTQILERGRRLGPYRLLALMGRGGMAEVHRAEFVDQLGAPGARPHPCVVKVLRPELAASAEAAQMFEDEIVLMRMLSHPNIVGTYDGGRIDGTLFLALELCLGANLSQVMKAAAHESLSIPAEVAIFLVHELALALAHVHSADGGTGRCLGLVHRDVSPSNVMLLSHGAVKLLDFGVAKATRGPFAHLARGRDDGPAPPRVENTRIDTIKGKLRYMAPEQVLGRPLDGRADLFALGVILWELLAGRPLFARDTPQETAALIIGGPPPAPLRPLRQDVSVALEAIVARTLQRDPHRRFQSGLALAAELAPLLPPAARAGRSLAGFLAAMGPRIAELQRQSSTPRSSTSTDQLLSPAPLPPSPRLQPVPSPRRSPTPRPPALPSRPTPPRSLIARALTPPGGRRAQPPPVPGPSQTSVAGWLWPAPAATVPASSRMPVVIQPAGGAGGFVRVLWIMAAASVGFAGGALWQQTNGPSPASAAEAAAPYEPAGMVADPTGVAIERIPPRDKSSTRPPGKNSPSRQRRRD